MMPHQVWVLPQNSGVRERKERYFVCVCVFVRLLFCVEGHPGSRLFSSICARAGLLLSVQGHRFGTDKCGETVDLDSVLRVLFVAGKLYSRGS